MAALTTMAAPTAVTDQHLDRAWRRLRRPDWPDTLAAALEHPLRGRCVRLLAQALARVEHRVDTAGPAPRGGRAGARAAWPTTPHATTPCGIDLKRAAAGDRDDPPEPTKT